MARIWFLSVRSTPASEEVDVELDEAAEAQKLHSSRVAQALAQGGRVHEERLPERPSRGAAVTVLVSVLALIITGVVGVMYGAISSGKGLTGTGATTQPGRTTGAEAPTTDAVRPDTQPDGVPADSAAAIPASVAGASPFLPVPVGP